MTMHRNILAGLGVAMAAGALPGMSPAERARGRFMRAPDGGHDFDFKGLAKGVADTADEVKKIAETVNKEIENLGKVTDETKGKADEALTKATAASDAMVKAEAAIKEIEQKLTGGRGGEGGEIKSLGTQFVEAEGLKSFGDRMARSTAKGSFGLSVKEITTPDVGGGIQPDRRAEILALPTRQFTIRNLLPVVATNSNAIEYVREEGFTNNAAMVAESALKPESDLTLTDETAMIRTLAHWIRASRQVLDDMPRLRGLIDTKLRYGLDLVEEAEILYGDGTGQHLHGIIPQATAYAAPAAVTAFLAAQVAVAGATAETSVDRLRIALLQASLAEYPADGMVLNPIDWAIIELTKTGDGGYLFANPTGVVGPTLWGKPVVATQALTVDKFLVGAFRLGATLYDRMLTEILASTEDRDNFVTNRVTIRAERRIGLSVERPEAFVYGDFGRVA